MRYAVLSDIHSNLEALTAVLDHLASERIDAYFCLGDVVGYGAEPSACLSRLEACKAVVVAGNHDLACVGKLQLEWFNELAREAILWTRDQLSFTELDALRRWPLTTVVEPFTLVHASLRHPERFEYLVDAAQAVETMRVCRTLLCLFGHTHLPCFLEYDRARHRMTRILARPDELTTLTYQDEPHTMRYLLNPGSVGQPRDGDPRASVAVIDTSRREVGIRRIPYDLASTQRKIRDAGLPGFLADRLDLGR